RVRGSDGRQKRERKSSDKGNASNQRHAERHVGTCSPLPGSAWPGRGGAGCRSSRWTLRRWDWGRGGGVGGVPRWLRGSDRRQGCGDVVGGVPRWLFWLGCWPRWEGGRVGGVW